jgi:hypothetical protein
MRFHGMLWERLDHSGRRTAAMALIGMLVAVLPAGSASAGSQAGTAALHDARGLPTWPQNPDWQRLVPGPSSDDVKPVRIVRTHGAVTNAQALRFMWALRLSLALVPGQRRGP